MGKLLLPCRESQLRGRDESFYIPGAHCLDLRADCGAHDHSIRAVACGGIRRVLNEQQLDAPGPRGEVAPNEARAIICIPTDQTGEALIVMLKDARQTSRGRSLQAHHIVRVFAPSCRSLLVAQSAPYHR